MALACMSVLTSSPSLVLKAPQSFGLSPSSQNGILFPCNESLTATDDLAKKVKVGIYIYIYIYIYIARVRLKQQQHLKESLAVAVVLRYKSKGFKEHSVKSEIQVYRA